MAEPPDRGTWLAAVARSLDAMPEAETEILEELSTHLDDRVADAITRGVDPAEAERRARNRLGDPAALGREIRRARRARRSALQLVGGGAFSFAYFSVAAIALSAVLLGVASGLTVAIGGWVISADLWRVPGSWVGLGAALVGFMWAARVAVGSVAAWAPWPFTRVRVVIAAVVLLLSMPAMLLLPGQELDPLLALLFPTVPVLAAVSALRAPRRVSLRPGWATVLVALAVVVVPSTLWSMTPVPASPYEAGVANPGVVGRSRDATLAVVAMPTWNSTGSSGEGRISVRTITFEDLAGWTGFTFEIWALEQAPDRGWRYADAPLVSVPYDVRGLAAKVTYAAPALRTPSYLNEVTVGIAPDGARSQLYPTNPELTQPWRGSVLDWWLGR